MNKGLLILAILLFAGAGVAFAYGYDRLSSAAEYQQMAERSLKKIQGSNDMAAMENESFQMNLDLEMYSKARQRAMIGIGGGAFLLLASVIVFFKSRRPATAV